MAHNSDSVKSPDEPRLYGVVGAEVLYTDPATVYESDIEPWPSDTPCAEWKPVEIEEWSVRDSIEHVPSIDVLLDWIIEWTAENGELTEDGFDAFADAAKHTDVCQAADALLTALASRVTFRMADTHLRSLWVTWDEAGEPLLDGQPMYVKADQLTATRCDYCGAGDVRENPEPFGGKPCCDACFNLIIGSTVDDPPWRCGTKGSAQ